MARPRIFISSTFFDLRTVRADLERFIKEMGYEPVLFERGHIPYGKDDALEDNCYREISGCDVVITIIGGKFGTESRHKTVSITQKELQTAIDLGKQIYVFVERSVLAEYRTYQINQDVKGFKPASVDDIRVFSAIEGVYALAVGNPIEPFEISEDIVRFLREQWAGLFQRLMQEASHREEFNIVHDLERVSATLKQLVNSLKDERGEVIKDILLSSNPVFGSIKKAIKIPYRVVFHDLKELEALLFARGFRKSKGAQRDGYTNWYNKGHKYGVRIAAKMFGKDGALKFITPEGWDEHWIERYTQDQDGVTKHS